MSSFFGHLQNRIARPYESTPLSHCTCGQQTFFANSVCLACQSPLGFLPEENRVHTLAPAGDQLWSLAQYSQSRLYKRCANLDTAAACNWLIDAQSPLDLCLSCRLNRTIPDLSVPGNDELWRKMENAKRALVAQLLWLGLPVQPKTDNETAGLAFDFLGPDLDGNKPTTGHANGLITLNIEEADDAIREATRAEMGEPYRTLLGHFRHEVGHYYWERLIERTDWLPAFRQLFGDERADYGAALQRHYQQGAPTGWEQGYISAYATMHPWEDWAETWAHYLHMTDTLDTALGFGMHLGEVELDYPPFTAEVLHDGGQGAHAREFLVFINGWIELVAMLNELSKSMGQPLFYPFVLTAPVVDKLYFVHRVVSQGGG